MTTLMHKQVLTGGIEWVANKALSMDASALTALQSLDGKSLTVEIAELGFPLCFTVSGQKVLVTSAVQEACVIRCELSTLSQIKDAGALTQLIKDDKLILSGDIQIAQAFSQVAKDLNIDWQSQLALHIGDVATYKLSLLQNKMRSGLSFFASQVAQDSSEWLLHEIQAAAHQSQVSDFSAQVTHLEKLTTTLEQRIQKLSQAIG